MPLLVIKLDQTRNKCDIQTSCSTWEKAWRGPLPLALTKKWGQVHLQHCEALEAQIWAQDTSVNSKHCFQSTILNNWEQGSQYKHHISEFELDEWKIFLFLINFIGSCIWSNTKTTLLPVLWQLPNKTYLSKKRATVLINLIKSMHNAEC